MRYTCAWAARAARVASLALPLVVSLHAAMSVALDASLPSPAPVGAVVTWSASVPDASPGTLAYRFSARPAGGEMQVVRDFGPLNTLDWTASEREGLYEVEVSVQNRDTGELATASQVYEFTSRLSDATPVISATAHPLVFLYSAPECPAGSRMRVAFSSPEGFVQYTPYKACEPGFSMNFYLAGMRPETEYTVSHMIDGGGVPAGGPVLKITTPAAPTGLPEYTVVKPPPAGSANGILLQSTFGDPVATDLYGNIVWSYAGGLNFLTRPEAGGTFFGIIENSAADASGEILREFDLAGNTLRETNAEQINAQLAALGQSPISAFHHEVRGMPDGFILALATTEKILTDVQGPGPMDVLGDMILVLDHNLQVVWAWNAFDHLDPYRMATLGETCNQTAGGCPPLRLAEQANDWLHGNALQLAADGNILYSARHQDWVMKIDYQNGQASGDVLWRLGKDGDFQLVSAQGGSWFSHQHDANFVDGSVTMALFDNGNVQRAQDANAHSRGQALQLDEQQRTAALVLNTDLGDYSPALGSAQRLANGDYHFNLGWIQQASSESVEVDSGGNTVYAIGVGVPLYRSFRMGDLYTP